MEVKKMMGKGKEVVCCVVIVVLLALSAVNANAAEWEQPFVMDSNTLALFHFDEGTGIVTYGATPSDPCEFDARFIADDPCSAEWISDANLGGPNDFGYQLDFPGPNAVIYVVNRNGVEVKGADWPELDGLALLGGPSTVELWIRIDEYPPEELFLNNCAQIAIQGDFIHASSWWLLLYSNGSISYGFNDPVNDYEHDCHTIYSQTLLPLYEWIHIAVERQIGPMNQISAVLYINGEVEVTGQWITPIYKQYSRPFNIGSHDTQWHNSPWRGAVDELRISNVLRYGNTCESFVYLPGDIDKDCCVDTKDLDNLTEDWLESNAYPHSALADLWSGDADLERRELAVGWPHGIHMQRMIWDPNGSELWCYYNDTSTHEVDQKIKTARARSTDGGIIWVDDGVVLDTGSPGSWDDQWSCGGHVWKDGSTYYMAYEGNNYTTGFQIGLATSTDGLNWTKYASNPILSPDPCSQWEHSGIGTPTLYKEGSTWYLYYHGYDEDNADVNERDVRMGVATASEPNGPWTKYSPASPPDGYTGPAPYPILSTVDGTWEAGTVGSRSTIYKEGSYYYMAYEGSTDQDPNFFDADWSSGFARSTNLLSWTKFAGNPVVPQTDAIGGNCNPEIIQYNSDWFLFVAVPGGGMDRYKLTFGPEFGQIASYEAEGPLFYHNTGSAYGDGWRADPCDPCEHMAYGPYTRELPEGALTARFWLKVDDNTGDDRVLTIDVFDSTTDPWVVKASRDILRSDWDQSGVYQPFDLLFDNYANHEIQFRVYYHGVGTVDFDKVEVHKTPMIASYEAEGPLFGHNTGYAYGDGWRADPCDPCDHMAYGPYTWELPESALTASFWLKVDDNTGDDGVLTIDVFDTTTHPWVIKASRYILKSDWNQSGVYQPFDLLFDNIDDHEIEFRAYYHGAGTVDFDKVEVHKTPIATYEAEAPYYHHEYGYACGGTDWDGWCAWYINDPANHMAFGPYTYGLPEGELTARFWLKVDNNTADNERILTLDVFDTTLDPWTKMDCRDIYRTDWSQADVFEPFDLVYDNIANHEMTFRVYYHDVNPSLVSFDKVEIYRRETCESGIYLPGDTNEDCKVNLKDVAALAKNWLECNSGM